MSRADSIPNSRLSGMLCGDRACISVRSICDAEPWQNMCYRSGQSTMLCLVGADDRKLEGVSHDTSTIQTAHILLGALEKTCDSSDQL